VHFQDQQRDRDREHTIAERFHAALAHRSTLTVAAFSLTWAPYGAATGYASRPSFDSNLTCTTLDAS
jgi:hypothetical protein